MDALIDAMNDAPVTPPPYDERVNICRSKHMRQITMQKHPLITLFYANLVVLTVGSGLRPLLPIYASRFGATPRTIGLYLTVVAASITIGVLLPGWLPERISRKRLLVGTSLAGGLALVSLGQATSLWQVIVLCQHRVKVSPKQRDKMGSSSLVVH